MEPRRDTSNMTRWFLFLGSINMCLVVSFGAFGAHALKPRLSSDMMAVYQTGLQYHFYHAIGLLIIPLVLRLVPSSRSIQWAAWLMLAGIILFSGSLYALSLTGIRWLGMITPLGGTAFICAWLLFAISIVRSQQP